MVSGVLVHEWVGETGGAEKVFDAFAEVFPDADMYCLWDDASRHGSRNLNESVLARTPLRRNKALALPFMPLVWRQLRSANEYEWMLISSHLFAHHAQFVGKNADTPKFVYAHTPARYIWEPELDQRGNNPLAKALSKGFQVLDRARAAEPVSIAANSRFVAERIERCWNREAQVIYPPVDVELIRSTRDWTTKLDDAELRTLQELPAEFVLGASRFVGYKKLDTAIRAAELAGLPAVIAGSGPDEGRLRERAAESSVPVILVVHPSDHFLYALYQRCSAFVFPPIEDFGIMPVEASAAGAPVIANRRGGTAETVLDGQSGFLADMEDEQDLKLAVEKAISLDRSKISMTSLRFSSDIFREKVSEWIPSGSPSLDKVQERS
ncbi:glycosyltransferase [Arthrobacter sp. NPDC058097]|uniref:glycosyltransferase n=1 Tax=Arthrobacter sp. NPDC058097 TaxID=3346340 RepID=UPI0036DCE263